MCNTCIYNCKVGVSCYSLDPSLSGLWQLTHNNCISFHLTLPIRRDLFGLTVICDFISVNKTFFGNFRGHQAIPQFPYHPGIAGMASMANLFYPEALGGWIKWFTLSAWLKKQFSIVTVIQGCR